ncbi:MAG: ferredoxin family protein [Adlercreutzia equolifaciens]
MRTPTDAELTAALKRSIVATKGHPVIACEKAVRAARKKHEDAARLQGWRGALGLKEKDAPALDEAMLVEAPCLGRVDESLIAAMAAYRSLDGTLVCAHCEGCEHEPGGTQVMDVIESAESLMSAFGSSFSVKFTDEMPARLTTTESALAARAERAAEKGTTAQAAQEGADSPATEARRPRPPRLPRGRRLDTSANLAAEAVADGLGLTDDTPAPKPMSPLPQGERPGHPLRFVPTRRTLLYNYLNRLGEPAADAVKNRVIGRVLIDTDACSSCRMCAVFCPTGALDKAEDGDFWGLVHRPAACVQCRSCESLCPKSAITVDDTVPMDQFMGREAVLFSMEKPTWQANKPDSMYNKIHSILGEDLEMCMF